MMIARAEAVKRRQPDWMQVTRGIVPYLAKRANRHDSRGEFVAENYAQMKDMRLFSALIPAALGGGGASYDEVCAVVNTLAEYCASTALAYAMDSHPVAVNVFKHVHSDERATAALTRIAGGELVIAGTGANDWLASNGEATAIERGYVVNAHKRFVSGGPGADLFVTSAVHDGDD